MKRALIGYLLFGVLAASIQYGYWPLAAMSTSVAAFVMVGRRATRASGYAVVRGHSHPGAKANVRIHEGAHGAAARLVRGRVIGMVVTGDDRRASGYTDVVIPNDPASMIGVSLAGLEAAPSTTSPSDLNAVDRVLATVPAPFRGEVLKEGRRIACKAARSSDVNYYVRKLEREDQ